MRGFPLRSRIAIKLAMGAGNRGMSCEMKWLVADVRVRLVLFTVWNTAEETNIFLACYPLLRLSHAPKDKAGCRRRCCSRRT